MGVALALVYLPCALLCFCYWDSSVVPYGEVLVQVGSNGASYKPPNINQLRGELLDREKASLDEEIRLNFFDKTHQNGTTLASDGCADTCSRPLVNALSINNKGAMFLKADNTKSETKVSCLRLMEDD